MDKNLLSFPVIQNSDSDKEPVNIVFGCYHFKIASLGGDLYYCKNCTKILKKVDKDDKNNKES